ncbi:hypothetical protein GCM10025868_45370 [Angustibacter aerolatus]|uniref:Uncharacterized protein n=1 Tax=Angustibacter aerolatus TaxID=1162965 RepID=A0ABQ6JNH2_9ACTN|nr:hypothetical protein [Angustibacter aerolatus]GMA89287.1 hypothetical protein GCM10025868_45370 [Angustibacter aerolatus]
MAVAEGRRHGVDVRRLATQAGWGAFGGLVGAPLTAGGLRGLQRLGAPAAVRPAAAIGASAAGEWVAEGTTSLAQTGRWVAPGSAASSAAVEAAAGLTGRGRRRAPHLDGAGRTGASETVGSIEMAPVRARSGEPALLDATEPTPLPGPPARDGQPPAGTPSGRLPGRPPGAASTSTWVETPRIEGPQVRAVLSHPGLRVERVLSGAGTSGLETVVHDGTVEERRARLTAEPSGAPRSGRGRPAAHRVAAGAGARPRRRPPGAAPARRP